MPDDSGSSEGTITLNLGAKLSYDDYDVNSVGSVIASTDY